MPAVRRRFERHHAVRQCRQKMRELASTGCLTPLVSDTSSVRERVSVTPEHGTGIEKASCSLGGSSSAVRLRPCSGLTPDLESWIESALGHRVRWAGGRNRICVSVHDLPDAVFGTEDARHPQRARGHLLFTSDPGFESLDFD